MSDSQEKWESKPQILNSHVSTIVGFFFSFILPICFSFENIVVIMLLNYPTYVYH